MLRVRGQHVTKLGTLMDFSGLEQGVRIAFRPLCPLRWLVGKTV